MNDLIDYRRANKAIPYLLYLYAFTISLSISATHFVLAMIVIVFLFDWWKTKTVGKVRKDFSLFVAIYTWKGISLIANGLILKVYRVKEIWYKIPYLIIGTFKITKDQLLRILHVLFIVNSILVIYAIGQKFLNFPVIYSSMYDSGGRLAGYLENPTNYASSVSLVTILCFSLHLFYKKTFGVYLPFLLIGILLSGSRGIIISATVVLITISYLKSLRTLLLSIGVVTLSPLVLVIISPNVLGRLSIDAVVTTLSMRTNYWYAAWETYLAHPVFGVGFQEFFLTYVLHYMDIGLISEQGNAHNLYLHELTEGGPVGFLLLLFIMIYFLRKYYQLYKRGGNILLSSMGIGISMSFLLLMIDGITDYTFEVWAIWFLLTFLMGICEAYRNGLATSADEKTG